MVGTIEGTGIYLWQLPKSGGADPKTLVARLQAANIRRIYVKIADGTKTYPLSGVDYTKEVVAAARASNFAVWGWHYIYGKSPNKEAEIAADQVSTFGLDGYIYNAEKEYRDNKRVAEAEIFVERLRELMGVLPLGFSSFKFPKLHPGLPWAELGGAADILMPQVYWVEAHDPAKQYDTSATQWAKLQPKAAMVPTGAAYTDDPVKWRPTPEEITAFLTHVRSKGVRSADFWVWDYVAKKTNSDLLDAITAFSWNTPTATVAFAAPALVTNDLKPGESIPAETEAKTCGKITSVIKRTDPEFATLVQNDNTDIKFKDEEGTGADRMMTSKLQTKLDALATLVASEWTGVKLRVTEAWDEDSEHAPGSLHYEGRAADLTSHPKDGAKLGRLGRLAVDAGCDWVLFEEDHIHVSMKK
jgi:hypothetical protein